METADSALKDKILTLRIDPELRRILKSRSEVSGRPQTTEALRLIHKGLATEEVMGSRSETGYNLMMAFAIDGARAVIRELVKMGETGIALRQYVTSAETREREAE